jgi:hypothetical protein
MWIALPADLVIADASRTLDRPPGGDRQRDSQPQAGALRLCSEKRIKNLLGDLAGDGCTNILPFR